LFENISDKVNEALTKQQVPVPPAPAAPPAGDPPAPTVVPEPNELEIVNAELTALKAERAAERLAHESALTEQRRKTAAAEAHKPKEALNNGRQDAQLAQAVRDEGGLALWNRLTEKQKCAKLGVADTSTIQTALVEQFFGRNSSSAAVQLAASDPAQYKLLRLVSKLRG
jgi:hypothetical protein